MTAYLRAQAARDGALMHSLYLASPDVEALMNGARQDLGTTRAGNLECYASPRRINPPRDPPRCHYLALSPRAMSNSSS